MTQLDAFYLTFDNLEEMVIFFDQNGSIVTGNASAEEQLEYGEDFDGHSIMEIFPKSFRSDASIDEQMDSLDEQIFQTEAYRKNRTCFAVEVRFYKYEYGRYAAHIMNTSEGEYLQRQIARVEQEAADAASVKSSFVANITHELRTPVNGILGNILELKDMESEPSKQRIINLVERGCADMNAIINNILDFSKLEAGKFTLEKKEFNFKDTIEYITSLHRPKMVEKGLNFSVSVADNVPDVLISDELRIVQLLNNLLSNACKFTNIGSVGLEIVKSGQVNNRVELFFLVIDSGIGISAESQDRLFKSFSQVDASISRRYGGTGLGLFISKQLVELMDGDIRVESTEGQGSVFSFSIWVEVPSGQEGSTDSIILPKVTRKPELFVDPEMEAIRTFGTEQNKAELSRTLDKLILSVEMENWDKAEQFGQSMRELTEDGPKEVKSLSLRIKMSVQKEDYDKVSDAVDKMRAIILEKGDI